MRREGLTYYDTPEEAGGPIPGSLEAEYEWAEAHGYDRGEVTAYPEPTPEKLAERAKRQAEHEQQVAAIMRRWRAGQHEHMKVVSEIARRRRKEDREFRRWQKARIRETLLADGARASS